MYISAIMELTSLDECKTEPNHVCSLNIVCQSYLLYSDVDCQSITWELVSYCSRTVCSC